MPELGDWVGALAGSPWVLLVLYAVVTLDGFFPPVPSESAVIVLAALAASGEGPGLALLATVAALGAFTGDQVAYAIGRRLGVGRTRGPRSGRSRALGRWAQEALAHRGAAFIVAARFVPAGRVAVNMTAGAVSYSRRRFTAIAAVAAVAWSAYSVALGVGAGHLLGDHPVLGVAVGVATGLVIGAVVDRLLRRVLRARRMPAPAAAEGGVPAPDPGSLADA